MLKYDLRNGLWLRKIWLILPITFFGMALCYIAPYMNSPESNMTLGGALFHLLEGTMPIDMKMKEFRVPFIWLTLQLGCVFFTVEYPTRDMNYFGQQIMIRSNNKGHWLLCKYVWNTLSVLIYWMVGYIMAIGFCAIHKVPMSLGVDGNIAGSLESCDMFQEYYSAKKMVWLLLIMPLLVSLTISFIQMFVGIMLNEIFAVGISMFMLVWSMCIMTPLAVGNYSMMQRSSVFYSNGLSLVEGIIIMLTIITATMLINYILFKHKDILEPKKNGE